MGRGHFIDWFFGWIWKYGKRKKPSKLTCVVKSHQMYLIAKLFLSPDLFWKKKWKKVAIIPKDEKRTKNQACLRSITITLMPSQINTFKHFASKLSVAFPLINLTVRSAIKESNSKPFSASLTRTRTLLNF